MGKQLRLEDKALPKDIFLVEQFAAGEVMTDLSKKEWQIGLPTGQGGFGCIDLAVRNASESVGNNALYVMQVEPSDDGPFSTELKFYQQAAKPEQIQEWICNYKLKCLGMICTVKLEKATGL